MEELGEEEDEKDVGGDGRGEGWDEEEDVGRDKEDMTNLLGNTVSSMPGRVSFGCRNK